MAGIKSWMMDREVVVKATMTVPSGKVSHEGTIEESSDFNLCKNLWSEVSLIYLHFY